MTTESADFDLLARWRAGDNHAGCALIKRHFRTLHRFFSNKAHGLEEDLIQLTFLACMESRSPFRGECSVRAYLLQIARFQLLTHYRKAYRNERLDFTTRSVSDLAPSPSRQAACQEERELLARALQQVPLDQQIALELTYWEGLPASEVAAVLGIPENTVYSRLRLAKEHLRSALQALSESQESCERSFTLLTAEAVG